MRKPFITGMLLVTMLFAASACIGDVDEQPADEAPEATPLDGAATEEQPATEEQLATDDLDLQILSEADLEELSQESESSLVGCSNQQISISQNICRSLVCGSRGSKGIHSCDYRAPYVYAHCDCRSGADPRIRWRYL